MERINTVGISMPIELEQELQKRPPDYTVVKRLIISLFNEAHERDFPHYEELSDEQKHEIVVWLQKMEDHWFPYSVRRSPPLESIFHTTLSSKVSHLAQHYCLMCSGDPTLPLAEENSPMVIRLVLPPHSYQSADACIKRAFKRAIRRRFDLMPNSIRHFEKKICLHIAFVLKESRRDKDVDNMAKLLVDGLKGILFADDSEIVHLSVVKVRQQGPENEYISVNIRESHLLNNDDVFSEEYFHKFSVPMLNLNDSMENGNAPSIVDPGN